MRKRVSIQTWFNFTSDHRIWVAKLSLVWRYLCFCLCSIVDVFYWRYLCFCARRAFDTNATGPGKGAGVAGDLVIVVVDVVDIVVVIRLMIRVVIRVVISVVIRVVIRGVIRVVVMSPTQKVKLLESTKKVPCLPSHPDVEVYAPICIFSLSL